MESFGSVKQINKDWTKEQREQTVQKKVIYEEFKYLNGKTMILKAWYLIVIIGGSRIRGSGARIPLNFISHYAPYLPPYILHNLCFSFILDITTVPREIRDFKIQRRDGNENVA